MLRRSVYVDGATTLGHALELARTPDPEVEVTVGVDGWERIERPNGSVSYRRETESGEQWITDATFHAVDRPVKWI